MCLEIHNRQADIWLLPNFEEALHEAVCKIMYWYIHTASKGRLRLQG